MSWEILRELLADQYDVFRTRLTRRLGSAELADESLNETWLRLHRQDEVGIVQSPARYVLQMAMNIATDHRRRESRVARRSDVRIALDVMPDPAPGPEREVAARLEVEALQRAIVLLPYRARAILIARRVEGLSQKQLADRFGMSPRMVRLELQRALEHCEAFLASDASAAVSASSSVIAVFSGRFREPGP